MQIPKYGYVGAGLMAFAGLMIGLGVRPVAMWTYPIVWYGYILLTDGLAYRIRRRSLLTTCPREFLAMLPLGLGFWVVFELYNLVIKNWYYVDYPRATLPKLLGFGLSWATVILIVFETTFLLEALGLFEKVQVAPRRISGPLLAASALTGAACLIYPVLFPSPYLFAPVWVGFVLLLDPLTYRLGGTSLLRDLEQGSVRRALCLMTAGIVTGFLWEFWNYWAGARWVYTVPITPNIRIFAMPIAGYLGFIPFALELYAMYYFVKTIYKLALCRAVQGAVR